VAAILELTEQAARAEAGMSRSMKFGRKRDIPLAAIATLLY
jgi:hypothetical protein